MASALDSGGVEIMLYNYYKYINRQDISFDFLVSSNTIGMIEKKLIGLESKVYHITPRSENILKFLIQTCKIIFESPRYDVVHVHNDHFSFLTLAIAFFAKVKVRVAHSHNAHMKMNPFIYAIVALCRKMTVLFATDFFACSSDAAIELFGKKKFESGEIILLKNAIELVDFQFNEINREKVRRELGIQDENVVCNIGRIKHQKNQMFLLEIFSELLEIEPDSILIIIGEGELKEALIHKASELCIISKVLFLGVRSDINKVLSAVDIFVLPSLYEGLGIVAIEAQAAGLPTLVSNFVPKEVAITELVHHIELKKSPKDWATEIVRSRGNKVRPNFLKELSLAGYNISDNSLLLENYYKKVAFNNSC